jgi:catechol 2,3-dioxygenase-like lactoylglutathione lyase family enzyme
LGRITGLDHLVLTVRDLDAKVRVYVEGLGMRLVTFREEHKALHFGRHKVNLHVAATRFEPQQPIQCRVPPICAF